MSSIKATINPQRDRFLGAKTKCLQSCRVNNIETHICGSFIDILVSKTLRVIHVLGEDIMNRVNRLTSGWIKLAATLIVGGVLLAGCSTSGPTIHSDFDRDRKSTRLNSSHVRIS